MNIIVRYYVKSTLLHVLVISVGFAMVMGTFEVIDKLDKIVKFSPSFNDMARFWAFVTPKYFKYLLPMSILMATLMVFGQASRYNELIAYKAAGGRLKKLFIPFIVIAIMLSAVDFSVDEYVSSRFNLEANNLLYKIKNKRNRLLYKTADIWFMEKKNMIVNANFYVPDQKTLYFVTVFITKENAITEIIKGRVCQWDGAQWVIKDGVRYGTEKLTTGSFSSIPLGEFTAIDVYEENELIADEMPFSELYKYNKRLKAAGYNNQKSLVDMYAKLAYPFTCLVMMLLGIAISSRFKMGSGLINAGIAIVISLLYWIAYAMAISFGYSGMFGPLFAPLIIPIMFAAAGFIMYKEMPE
ncbi:LptF/LptG family permease [Candidatus Magnetominusculus xianensis]|uniref:LPS export ABC transporter permease LptG n=1 Tax=Candidatus Magnetominusculus xianensis TaxID=1748249 RepID=A0ABR5SM41_9BACT|nr:LptF/LptG family permease [Candidatus Magnetominusculus xianensis]KWT92161.1 LPS export ABC transporter permease LptG [Candidatus Magnetominusculus xianensis]MBF0404668.1 LptF/LptG family permease [Nitrospirota bacterium]